MREAIFTFSHSTKKSQVLPALQIKSSAMTGKP